MKADPTVQRRLLELAEVDAELNRINHRRRTLPELEEIGRAERDVQTRKDSLVASQTSHSDLDREVKRLESEVEQVRQREERDRGLMESTGSSKQLEDLQHELETLGRRQAALEDDLLEVMERREAVETEVGYAKDEVSRAETVLADVQGRRDEALADLDTAEAKRLAEREAFVSELPADLLALYDRIREHRGVGAGLLQGGRCGACRIELDRSALSEVREAPADEVVRCEECGAIIVRTKESGL